MHFLSILIFYRLHCLYFSVLIVTFHSPSSFRFSLLTDFDYKKFLLFPCEPFDPKNRAKVYQCPYCTYVSNNPNYVLMHSGRHRLGSSSPIIERRIIYGCAICKHKTTDSSQIQDHFLLHVPDMKIACPLNRIFPINQNYEYQCQLCKIKYLNTQTMVQHLFSRHLLYRCTFCDTLRPDYASLERYEYSFNSSLLIRLPTTLVTILNESFSHLF